MSPNNKNSWRQALYSRIKSLKKALIIMCAFTLTSCASYQGHDVADPWQGFNRSVYVFNDTLDKGILKPLALAYDAITPGPVDKGITNFFANIADIGSAVNNLLQGKLNLFFTDIGRIAINTTVGVAGLFDVASEMGLQKSGEDLGQTMGYWGMNSGPYVMLPIFGPSSLRDAPAKIISFLLQPEIRNSSTQTKLDLLNAIDTRSDFLRTEESTKELAKDRYTFIKNAYLDHRQFLVTDGVLEGDAIQRELAAVE